MLGGSRCDFGRLTWPCTPVVRRRVGIKPYIRRVKPAKHRGWRSCRSGFPLADQRLVAPEEAGQGSAGPLHAASDPADAIREGSVARWIRLVPDGACICLHLELRNSRAIILRVSRRSQVLFLAMRSAFPLACDGGTIPGGLLVLEWLGRRLTRRRKAQLLRGHLPDGNRPEGGRHRAGRRPYVSGFPRDRERNPSGRRGPPPLPPSSPCGHVPPRWKLSRQPAAYRRHPGCPRRKQPHPRCPGLPQPSADCRARRRCP